MRYGRIRCVVYKDRTGKFVKHDGGVFRISWIAKESNRWAVVMAARHDRPLNRGPLSNLLLYLPPNGEMFLGRADRCTCSVDRMCETCEEQIATEGVQRA